MMTTKTMKNPHDPPFRSSSSSRRRRIRVPVWTMGIPGRPRLSSCLPPTVIVIMSANAGESRAILAPLNPAAAVASTSTTEHRYYKYYYYYDYEQYYCDYYYHKPTYEDESWWE